MTRVENRLKDVFNGLSPEDKARLIIEDQFRADPVLKPGDVYKMVARIKPDEGFRFNKIISGYNSLIRNFSTMTDLSDQIRKRLLQRDRFLWYRRALRDVEEAMVFDPKVSNPLLVDNSNIKIGRPLEMDLTLARLRLEVWSSKNRRCAWPLNGSVELSDKVLVTLDTLAQSIRILASALKAVARYISERGVELGLRSYDGAALLAVTEIAAYDRPLWEEITDAIAKNQEFKPPPGAIFAVERRWALVWEEIGEDAVTAKRIREDPENWIRDVYDDQIKGDSLGFFKDFARNGDRGLLEDPSWKCSPFPNINTEPAGDTAGWYHPSQPKADGGEG